MPPQPLPEAVPLRRQAPGPRAGRRLREQRRGLAPPLPLFNGEPTMANDSPLTQALDDFHDVNERLKGMERLLRELAGTPRARVERLLAGLRRLLADGAKDPANYR